MILIVLGLVSCNKKDEHYYQSNPKELQKAIQECPNKQPEGATCSELSQVYNRMSKLAYELQLSPQEFGNKILAKQQTIAKQKIELKNNKANAELNASLEQNKRDLADYLIVVKWLESPES